MTKYNIYYFLIFFNISYYCSYIEKSEMLKKPTLERRNSIKRPRKILNTKYEEDEKKCSNVTNSKPINNFLNNKKRDICNFNEDYNKCTNDTNFSNHNIRAIPEISKKVIIGKMKSIKSYIPKISEKFKIPKNNNNIEQNIRKPNFKIK